MSAKALVNIQGNIESLEVCLKKSLEECPTQAKFEGSMYVNMTMKLYANMTMNHSPYLYLLYNSRLHDRIPPWLGTSLKATPIEEIPRALMTKDSLTLQILRKWLTAC